MTAVRAVRKERSIEMLTDSAVICGGTGKVLGFMPKQFAAAIPQCMIGATGDTRTVFEFGRRLHLRGIGTFDQLVEHAAELWRESLDAAHSERWRDLVGFQALALAGWSKQREQLELYSLTSDESGLSENLTVLATSPTPDTNAMLAGFIEALEADLEAFTTEDGIALFEQLRRYPSQFAADTAPAVGGEIHRITITETGVSTKVVHRWPDQVGERIEPEEVRHGP